MAIVTSLSMLANASPQINAIDQIAIPQRIQNAFPPTFTNPLQPISNDFSINSIEEKIKTFIFNLFLWRIIMGRLIVGENDLLIWMT